jgi:hypothetical protein
MSTTGRTMMDDSTGPSYVVNEGEWNGEKNIGKTVEEGTSKRGNRSGCPRIYFTSSNRESVPTRDGVYYEESEENQSN